jgi:hypothetical protein
MHSGFPNIKYFLVVGIAGGGHRQILLIRCDRCAAG